MRTTRSTGRAVDARTASLFALAALWWAPADAGDSGAAPAAASLPPVTVTVTGHRFLDEDTSGITNLPLSVERVPQSIGLLNSDFDRRSSVPTPIFQSLAAGLYPGEPRSIALSARRDF